MLDPNDSYGMRTRQISRLSPNGHNRRRLAFRARLGERRLPTQLSRSGLVSRTAGVDPKRPLLPSDHLGRRSHERAIHEQTASAGEFALRAKDSPRNPPFATQMAGARVSHHMGPLWTRTCCTLVSSALIRRRILLKPPSASAPVGRTSYIT